jgi:lipopolysaccharide export system permease protein
MMLLDRYIGGATLRAFFLISAGLTALFSLLTFVEQLSYVGQGHYQLTDALTYVLLTAPYRLLQLTPVSMLLSSLLALGALARNSELTAFRSLGVSEARIIGSVLKLALPIIAVLFIFAQFIIPPAQQLAQRQQAAALNDAMPLISSGSFWAENNRQYLNVQDFEYGNVMLGIEIYAFDDDGALKSYTHADRADIEPDGTWLLTGVLRKRIIASQFVTDQPASMPWNSFISANQVKLLTLPPETMPPIALYEYIQQLKRLHQQAIRYEQKFWTMVSVPLSIIAMVLIAAPFVFGSQRSASAGRQLLVGTILGIVFLLSQQITGYLGLLLDLNPAVSALAPSVLLLGLGFYLLQRAHDTLVHHLTFAQALEKLPIPRFLRGKQNDEDEAEAEDIKQEVK